MFRLIFAEIFGLDGVGDGGPVDFFEGQGGGFAGMISCDGLGVYAENALLLLFRTLVFIILFIF